MTIILKGGYRQRFREERLSPRRRDRGESTIVDKVILLGGLAVLCFVIIVFLSKAINSQSADAASCVEGGWSGYNQVSEASADCGNEHAQNNSFTQDSVYQSRY